MKKLLYILIIAAFAQGCKEEDVTTDNTQSSDFTLTSEAVADGKLLESFRCEQKVDGKEASIPLKWSNLPEGAGSLAIIMYHYPNPEDTLRPNSYLLLWDIDPTVTSIAHGAADDGPWFMGSNKDGNAISYTSPCSSGSGTHTYHIKIFALSETPSSLPTESTLDVTYDVLYKAIQTVEVIDTAILTFTDTTP